MTLSFIYLALWISFWLGMLRRPKVYVLALFVTAPWIGLWVKLVWMLDPFKIGLLLSPILLLRVHKVRRLGAVTFPLVAFAGYAILLMSWQIFSGEVTQFDRLNHLTLGGHLVAANGMFLLRIGLLAIVVTVVNSGKDAQRCLAAYTTSVSVLAAYAIIQELAFALFGTPITAIKQYGLFDGASVYFPVDVFGIQLVRAAAFCNEPKDMALFIMPAIAYAFTSMKGGGSPGRRAWRRAEFCCLLCAGVLTFSSSLLLLGPLVLVALEALQPRRSLTQLLPRYFVYGCVALLVFPAVSEVWNLRVATRFTKSKDLLQEAREAPALEFFKEQFPRALAGYGVGTQAFYLPAYMADEYRYRLLDYQGAAGLDSFWFSLLLDLGLPGALLFGWCCIKVLRCPAAAKQRTWDYRAILVAVLITGIALPVDLRSAVLWLFLGLAVRSQQLSSGAFAGGGARYMAARLYPERALVGQPIQAGVGRQPAPGVCAI
jgi:hypothetical protein